LQCPLVDEHIAKHTAIEDHQRYNGNEQNAQQQLHKPNPGKSQVPNLHHWHHCASDPMA
tara:strand:+ start:1523 stop:1699 length:177 start_codon:yes stop_codon:yes gene_type:complete